VPGKTAAPHEIPYSLKGDKPASIEAATKPIAERVHKRLNEIDGVQISDGTIADGKLASSNNGVYRMVMEATGLVNQQAAGLYMLGSAGGGNGPLVVASGVDIDMSAASSAFRPPPMIALGPTSYAVAGKSTKFALQGVIAVNGVATLLPDLKIFLRSVTATGEANKLKLALGAAVGAELKFPEPAKENVEPRSSADFAPPAEGLYAIGLELSGGAIATRVISVQVRLMVHNV
jgi:hypothetical protein